VREFIETLRESISRVIDDHTLVARLSNGGNNAAVSSSAVRQLVAARKKNVVRQATAVTVFKDKHKKAMNKYKHDPSSSQIDFKLYFFLKKLFSPWEETRRYVWRRESVAHLVSHLARRPARRGKFITLSNDSERTHTHSDTHGYTSQYSTQSLNR
jgi:hypothetical protein